MCVCFCAWEVGKVFESDEGKTRDGKKLVQK